MKSAFSSFLNKLYNSLVTIIIDAGCTHSKADIVFLLDSSASEGSSNFKKQLQFVQRFVQAYDIGSDKVQVSIVTFSTSPHNAFYLNTYHDKTSLLNAIGKVSYISGKCYISAPHGF